MTDAINWHPNGTPGPFIVDAAFCEGDHPLRIAMPNVRTMPGATIAMVEHNWNDASYGERRISWKEAETNARAIAEVPAMVMALRELDSSWREFFPDGPDGKYALVSIGAEYAATWRNICAILSRIDGGAA